MCSKLKVNELRAQLYLRSLDASGTKPILDRRLEEAILKEKKEKEAAKDDKRNGTSNGSKKRRRGSEENNASERLQEMGIRELRKLAASHGMATNGSKSDLIDRVSTRMERGSEGTVEGKEVEGDNMEKLVTMTKKGGAVLDQWLPDSIKSRFHILLHGEETYDAMLNQTNVGENNNKFYVIQALESDDGGTFMIYNRWGRVGVRGQDKLHGPYISREDAIHEFELKFYDKTKNHWSDRRDFASYPRCYTWLEMDYSETEKAPVTSTDGSVDAQLKETKLDTHIAKFVSLICNINMMKQQMLEIGYNAEKLPLGKLSKSTILKGYDVLRRISDVIEKSDRKKLEQLSGEFYTVIPHDFGFKKMREFVIDNPYKLKCKLEMVAALEEIEIATKVLQDDAEIQDDPLHCHYQQLCCELIPVEACSQEFLMIKKYMSNTHAETHSSYAVDIVQIFKVSRHGENERFAKFSNTKNRMLLWHGSRLSNWTGILSQGLRIAPPEAPVTGYMFGKGVYFADMFSKSANYCYASQESAAGVLLLCEVALGDMSELLTADYNADSVPKGKLSAKGVGATAPDMSESYSLEDVIVPLGKPKERTGPKGSLLYNEYIVYNVDQIRMRFVVQVNFNFNKG